MTNIGILAAAIGAQALYAQGPAAFDVASVRQNRLDDRIVTIDVGPGPRFAARGYTLVLLIQRAYGVMDWNVTGGPDWIRADRFDVNARAGVPGNLKESELRPMLARLLEDRFKLKLRHTTRVMPAYALDLARSGVRVQKSEVQEDDRDSFRFSATGLSGHGISMRDFARFVAGKLGVVGVDETGLSGYYDVQASWRVGPDAIPPGSDPRESLRDAAFAAIERQLGLRFAQRLTSVETLVIEHAERPSELEN